MRFLPLMLALVATAALAQRSSDGALRDAPICPPLEACHTVGVLGDGARFIVGNARETRSDLLSIQLFQVWSGAEWEDDHRYLYSYDGDLLSERLTQIRTGAEWADERRVLYTYDDGVQVEALFQMWSGGVWIDEARYVYAYEGALLAEVLIEEWMGEAWERSGRNLFSYEGGLLVETLVQEWTGSAWANDLRITVSYTDGLRSVELQEGWTGSEWVPLRRYTYAYDGDMLSTLLVQFWTGTVWSDRYLYTYSFEGERIAELLVQAWEQGSWVNDARSLFTYSQTSPSSAAPHASESLEVYPNPVRDVVTIAFRAPQGGEVTAAVYDVLGRRVATMPPRVVTANEHEMRWDLTPLPAGAYTLELRGAVVGTRRITVIR